MGTPTSSKQSQKPKGKPNPSNHPATKPTENASRVPVPERRRAQTVGPMEDHSSPKTPTQTAPPVGHGGPPSTTQHNTSSATSIDGIIDGGKDRMMDLRFEDKSCIRLPEALINFMMEANSGTEWKGRCRIFVGYLFIVTRHLPKEIHRDLLHYILPATLRDDTEEHADSLAYLSRQIKTGLEYLKKMCILHLNRWYKTDAAAWWRELKDQQTALDKFAEYGEDFPFPLTVRDLFVWNGKAGFEFTHCHMVHFWRRFLQFMDLEVDANGDIGWLKDDSTHDYFWYINLRSVALRILLAVIRTQGPDPIGDRDLEDFASLKLAFRNESFDIPDGTVWPIMDAKWRKSAAPLFNDSSRYPGVSHDLKLHYDLHFYSDDVLAGRSSNPETASDMELGSLLDPLRPRQVLDTDTLQDMDTDNELDDGTPSWYDEAKDSTDLEQSILQFEADCYTGSGEHLADQVKTGWDASMGRLSEAKVLPEYKSILLPLNPDVPLTSQLSSGMELAGQRWSAGDIEVKVAMTEAHLDQYYSAVEEQINFLQDRKDSLIIRFQTVEAKKRKIRQIIELRNNLKTMLDEDEVAISRAEEETENYRKKARIRPAEANKIHPLVSSLRRRREVTGTGFTYSKDALRTSVMQLGLPNDNGHFDVPAKQTRDTTTPLPEVDRYSLPPTPVRPGFAASELKAPRQDFAPAKFATGFTSVSGMPENTWGNQQSSQGLGLGIGGTDWRTSRRDFAGFTVPTHFNQSSGKDITFSTASPGISQEQLVQTDDFKLSSNVASISKDASASGTKSSSADMQSEEDQIA